MKKTNPELYDNGFYFIPLGGSEEFGVNFNLYACDGKWMIFDCGIGFADHRMPGVDILLPDPKFIEPYKENLLGLVVTHAHEDHIGAVPYLWSRLRCPVYCTKFTAAVMRAKFNEFPSCKDAVIIEIEAGKDIDLGPFHLSFIRVAHSIPQAVSTVIETSYGRVVHSGDWNLDPAPVIDLPTDEAAFRAAGNKGILAYIGDSTNAPNPGRSRSETDVEQGLIATFKDAPSRVLVTIFASNIGRVQSICRAAEAAGRSVCLLGRSLHRMVSCARDCGYLRDIQEFVSPEDSMSIPADKILFIVTGSQGEAQAALSRIARGEWREIKLGKGDTAVFSSKAIPGNEKEINTVKNYLSASGVRIIDTSTSPHLIHVSGHPYRDDIVEIFDWLKPQLVIPVHGERVMLEAQAQIARDCGVPYTIIPNNGSVIRLAPDTPAVIDHVATGSLAVEPQRIIPTGHKAIAERRKMQFSGVAHVTVVLNGRGDLACDPQITLHGLIDHEDEAELDIIDDIVAEVKETVKELKREEIWENDQIEEEIRIMCRRMLIEIFGFKTKVSVHLLRV